MTGWCPSQKSCAFHQQLLLFRALLYSRTIQSYMTIYAGCRRAHPPL